MSSFGQVSVLRGPESVVQDFSMEFYSLTSENAVKHMVFYSLASENAGKYLFFTIFPEAEL